ncbi:heme oxygenase (biliverdin-producing) [Acaryochloris marina NIES-2412]|uniref:biliverdin-producing heme oxygenase n=1 Tax=Acaryochloris marina TaxID=155978 RepID=UPI004058D638
MPSAHPFAQEVKFVMSCNLACALRQGTQHAHVLAENTALMKAWMKGMVVFDVFRELLVNLYFVYGSLEQQLYSHQTHPVLGQIYWPSLNRQDNLRQDLVYFYGQDWQQHIRPRTAGLQYAARIGVVGLTAPERLVAHAYVRYMGDLSGGQQLQRIARTALSLPLKQGTRLYAFEDLPSAEAKKRFKQRYRDALNHLPIGQETVQQIVEEANLAFRLNCDLMQSLEVDLQAALGEEAFQSITQGNRSPRHPTRPSVA